MVHADSLESAGIPEEYKKQSTDVLHIVRERFSIDDSRELSASALQTPFEAKKRVFVILVKDIATEAQNALLKLFEEPPEHAQFYLVVPKTIVLLPTLVSRMSMLAAERMPAVQENRSFHAFVSASYAERLAVIAEKTKEKDRAWITEVLRGCEMEYSKKSEKNASLLKAVVFVRQYIDTKGASAKMLLEDIALRMPVQ